MADTMIKAPLHTEICSKPDRKNGNTPSERQPDGWGLTSSKLPRSSFLTMRGVRILPENTRDALFVHIAKIEYMTHPGLYPEKDVLDFPRTLELLEEDPQRGLAVQAPRHAGPPRLSASEIAYTIGRERGARKM